MSRVKSRHIFLEIHEVRKGMWAFFFLDNNDCDADYHRGVRANHINQIKSQSCAVAKSRKLLVGHWAISYPEPSIFLLRMLDEWQNPFGQSANQSDLAYKRLTAPKASIVWFSYSHNCILSNGVVFHYVCRARRNILLLCEARIMSENFLALPSSSSFV